MYKEKYQQHLTCIEITFAKSFPVAFKFFSNYGMHIRGNLQFCLRTKRLQMKIHWNCRVLNYTRFVRIVLLKYYQYSSLDLVTTNKRLELKTKAPHQMKQIHSITASHQMWIKSVTIYNKKIIICAPVLQYI